ncbi:MAG TPA: hypothetical protein VFC71_00510 [Candidatus Polarisedimenticolia bacterium]|nr:hypothetical protein [Candidatus Polarisedimenticolia bacterium]
MGERPDASKRLARLVEAFGVLWIVLVVLDIASIVVSSRIQPALAIATVMSGGLYLLGGIRLWATSHRGDRPVTPTDGVAARIARSSKRVYLLGLGLFVLLVAAVAYGASGP